MFIALVNLYGNFCKIFELLLKSSAGHFNAHMLADILRFDYVWCSASIHPSGAVWVVFLFHSRVSRIGLANMQPLGCMGPAVVSRGVLNP